MTGQNLRLPVDMIMGCLEEKSVVEYVAKLQQTHPGYSASLRMRDSQ